MNVLFFTLDQFRADAYRAAGNRFIETPTLDRWARQGIRLTQHYSQAAPCSPGRAALYTGTYQMNNRVVANGTPAPRGLANIATVLRDAGYDPTLFGYTDQGVNPDRAVGNDDPRLDNYDGVLEGMSVGLYMSEDQGPWVRELRARGHVIPANATWHDVLDTESQRPAADSLTAFVTDRFLQWLDRQSSGWAAHVSYLRPHPPYAAAGEYSRMVDPASVELPISPIPLENRDPLFQVVSHMDATAAPSSEEGLRHMMAQYYGMIAELDAQLARISDALIQRHEDDDTLIVVVADHGEQLGDHGLKEKLAYFPQSYHIVGIWRDPRREPGVVDAFTENVDILPTLAQAVGVDIPRSCDGESLYRLFENPDAPWRRYAHYEWDWRYVFIGERTPRWPNDRRLSEANLAVSVGRDAAFVQFGDGTSLAFDVAADPTWRTPLTDPVCILEIAGDLLQWRQVHLNRDLTDMLLTPQRSGHWPSLVK